MSETFYYNSKNMCNIGIVHTNTITCSNLIIPGVLSAYSQNAGTSNAFTILYDQVNTTTVNLKLGVQINNSFGSNGWVLTSTSNASAWTPPQWTSTSNSNYSTGVTTYSTYISGSNVGIGTTIPQSNLDLWGTFGITIGGSNVFSITSNGINNIRSGGITCSSINTQNNNINAGSGTITTTGLFTSGNISLNGKAYANDATSTSGARPAQGWYIWTDFLFGMELQNQNGTWNTTILTRNTDGGIIFKKSDGVQLMYINNGGSVGIGTTNPASQLHVHYLSASSMITLSDVTSGNTNTAQIQQSSGTLYIKTGTNTTSPSGGVYLSSGATAWTAVSDGRLKNIISPISNALSNVSLLNPIIYSFISESSNIRRVGLIAQDVLLVQPECVNIDTNGYYGVSYPELVPLAFAAIKELTIKNTALEARIAALEAKLS